MISDVAFIEVTCEELEQKRTCAAALRRSPASLLTVTELYGSVAFDK
jgi:hypothetical protein